MAGRCLVADESGVIRRIMRLIMEDLGYEVTEASDAMSALLACRDAMPSIAFVEWHLPGRDPLDLLRDIRRLEGGAEPRVVYLTSENDLISIARAMRAGATTYFMKPFDRDILEEKVRGLELN